MRRDLDRRHGRRQRVHDLGIELRSRAPPQLAQRFGRAARGTIGAHRGHGVEGVGDVHDAREERNLVAAQPVRITLAVGPLVVQFDDRQVRRQEMDAAQDARADAGMLLR